MTKEINKQAGSSGKSAWTRFTEYFSENLRAFVTLVRMQLKEKLDLSYFRSTRQLIFKLVWMIVEFAAITAAISVVFYFVKLLGLFSLVNDIPVSVIALIFGIMLLLSVVTDTVGLMKSLYLSKDNSVLLTFPATPSLIFLSKLAVYYLYEIRKSIMFTVPMFIAYGIIKGYSLYYYPWLLLMFALISTVPVLLSAILSIPSMYIYIFLNRVKILQYIVYSLAVILGIALLWLLIGLVPENIDFIETWGETYYEIQAFLKTYTKTFTPIYLFTELIVGKTVGLKNIIFHSGTLPTLLIILAAAAVLLLLCFLISKPLFCKMAATPFEFKKKNSIKEQKNRKRGAFRSALNKELISGLRSNSFLKLLGILAVIMPMAIFLLNKLYSAMNTKFLGTQMTVCFNILIIMLILLMTNINMASVYSQDGASSYLNKVQPAPYSILLFSKLFFPMIISLIGTAVTLVTFAVFKSIPTLDVIMIGIAIYGFYIAHLFMSAESDIMNPQYEQYATFNDQANNPNETSSALMCIIISAAVFIIALFFSSDSVSGAWWKLAIAAVVLAIFKVFTFLSKIKAFYKEKQ